MKSNLEIQERIDMRKQLIESKKNLDGGLLTDGVIHDLMIQKDTLEWVLKD
ncbi:MAG: hypothetical protein AABX29_00465 [Nanoarchaeota archaeon]